MDVTPLIKRDAKVIQSYKGGIFKVSNTVYDQPIIVMPDAVLPWTPHDPIQVDDFAPLADYKIEVLLLGTGDKQKMLSPAMCQQIKSAYRFTIDAMDNGAACRTYNVLMAEGRLVAVALTA